MRIRVRCLFDTGALPTEGLPRAVVRTIVQRLIDPLSTAARSMPRGLLVRIPSIRGDTVVWRWECLRVELLAVGLVLHLRDRPVGPAIAPALTRPMNP